MIGSGYDAELQRHNQVLRRAAAVRDHEHVLDIGCGAGQTTREAAQAATGGSALGVDIGPPARGEGLRNVAFEQGDAQIHEFPAGRFDLAMSRFGTMFFTDPVAAFTNIRHALRPGGRLAMLVWQSRDDNEWAVAIRDCYATDPGPAFSLADPPTVREILRAAGFTGIDITDVHEPVYYGPDVDAAHAWIHGFANVRAALANLTPTEAAGADTAMRQILIDQQTPDGVWFNSRAWLVTARQDEAGDYRSADSPG